MEQAKSLDLDLIGIPLHKGLSLADRIATALRKLVLIEPADAATATTMALLRVWCPERSLAGQQQVEAEFRLLTAAPFRAQLMFPLVGDSTE